MSDVPCLSLDLSKLVLNVLLSIFLGVWNFRDWDWAILGAEYLRYCLGSRLQGIELPKITGPFLAVRIVRVILYWGLYSSPPTMDLTSTSKRSSCW